METVQKPRTLILAFLVVSAAAILFIHRHPPAGSDFYPSCPLVQSTGLLCPACGSLRAVHALSHGCVADAFAYNPLLVLLLPVSVGWLAVYFRKVWLENRFVPVACNRTLVPVIGAVALLYFIIRNLT